jgi:hypothetical protein
MPSDSSSVSRIRFADPAGAAFLAGALLVSFFFVLTGGDFFAIVIGSGTGVQLSFKETSGGICAAVDQSQTAYGKAYPSRTRDEPAAMTAKITPCDAYIPPVPAEQE